MTFVTKECCSNEEGPSDASQCARENSGKLGLDLLQCVAGDNEESPKRKNRFHEPTKSNGADAKYRMMDCVTSR